MGETRPAAPRARETPARWPTTRRWRRKARRCGGAALAIACLAVAASAWSQEQPQPVQPVQPVIPESPAQAAGPVGPVFDDLEPAPRRAADRPRGLTFELTTEVRNDNNVRRTRFDQAHALALEAQPRVYLQGGAGSSRLMFGYEGAYVAHVNLSDEDYADHALLVETALAASKRVRVEGGMGLEYGHDPRGGTTSRLLALGSPDRWREHTLGASLHVGRRIAKAEITASFDVRGRRYLNNNQSSRDLEERAFWLRTRWNFTPRFAAVIEGGHADIDYLSASSDLDGGRSEILYGVIWTATAKTSGEFKVGQLRREFDSPTRADRKGGSWDVRINWAPRPFSRFTFFTNRSIEESASALGGGTVRSQTGGIRWRHGFTSRVELDAGLEYTESSFDGGREDRLTFIDAAVNVQLRRWLDLAAGFEYTQRDSSARLARYDSQVVFVRLDARWHRRLGR